MKTTKKAFFLFLLCICFTIENLAAQNWQELLSAGYVHIDFLQSDKTQSLQEECNKTHEQIITIQRDVLQTKVKTTASDADTKLVIDLIAIDLNYEEVKVWYSFLYTLHDKSGANRAEKTIKVLDNPQSEKRKEFHHWDQINRIAATMFLDSVYNPKQESTKKSLQLGIATVMGLVFGIMPDSFGPKSFAASIGLDSPYILGRIGGGLYFGDAQYKGPEYKFTNGTSSQQWKAYPSFFFISGEIDGHYPIFKREKRDSFCIDIFAATRYQLSVPSPMKNSSFKSSWETTQEGSPTGLTLFEPEKYKTQHAVGLRTGLRFFTVPFVIEAGYDFLWPVGLPQGHNPMSHGVYFSFGSYIPVGK